MRSEHKSTFGTCSARCFFRPIVWVGIGLSVFQQFVGINVAFYYSSTLWRSVGVDPTDSFFYSFTTSIINIIGTVVAMIFVDRIGRRPLAPRRLRRHGDRARPPEAWAFSYDLVDGKLPETQGARVALIAAHALRLLLRDVVGRRRLGLPRRDVPDPTPRRGARRGRLRPSGSPTGRSPLVSRRCPSWNLSATYVICTIFAALSIPFVLKLVKGDQGQGTGGDGLTPAPPREDPGDGSSPRCRPPVDVAALSPASRGPEGGVVMSRGRFPATRPDGEFRGAVPGIRAASRIPAQSLSRGSTLAVQPEAAPALVEACRRSVDA